MAMTDQEEHRAALELELETMEGVTPEGLRALAGNALLLFEVHKAVEDVLIEMRDSGMMMGPHANGLVVRGQDGSSSPVIRIGTRNAAKMVLEKAAEALERRTNKG